MLTIIETGGKQLLVKKNDIIYVEKLEGKVGDKITFDKVLMHDQKIGKPFIKDVVVTGIIEKQGKQRKIVVYRHNPKSTHKRKYGHRQPYTRVKIIDVKG